MIASANKAIRGWEQFHHDADVGVRGYGSTLAEAFENAARGMTAIITPLDKINAEESVRIICRAPDIEMLLNDWLNALIYEMSTRKMLFKSFDVEIDNGSLSAVAIGERVDVTRHAPAVEPKGATLTELAVSKDIAGLWLAQCVIDV